MRGEKIAENTKGEFLL